MKLCSKCGRENMDHENFCSSCGTMLNQVPIGKTCPSCNAAVAPDDRFCDNCGAALPETPSSGMTPGSQKPISSTRPMGGNTPLPHVSNMYQPPVQNVPPVIPQQQMMPNAGYPGVNQSSFPGPSNQQKKNKFAFILSFVLVLVLVIGGGLSYYFFIYKKDQPVAQNGNNDPVTTQGQNTVDPNQGNQTGQNQPVAKPEPTKPQPTKPEPTNNNNVTVTAYFSEFTRGSFAYPVQYYQAADFDRDGLTEFVAGTTSDVDAHVDVLSWNGADFVRVGYFDVPGPIYEINASVPREDMQWLYIPSLNNITYTLEKQAEKWIYDEVDLGAQMISIVEGYFDNDDITDFAFLTLKADGSKAFVFRPSTGIAAQELVVPDVMGNAFLADLDGNGMDELLYIAQDTDGIYKVFVNVWDGNTFVFTSATTFADSLINYFPGDLNGDGYVEIITTNYNSALQIEGRVWEWSPTQLDLLLVDKFIVDHSSATSASPIVGDFTGDGIMDIMMLVPPIYGDVHAMDYIIYTR